MSNVIDFAARRQQKMLDSLTEEERITAIKKEFDELCVWYEEQRSNITLLNYPSFTQLFDYIQEVIDLYQRGPYLVRMVDQLKIEMIMDHSQHMIAQLQVVNDRVRAFTDKRRLLDQPTLDTLQIAANITSRDADVSFAILTLQVLPEILIFPSPLPR